MGGQSTLGQGKVLEEGPSAQPRARPGPVSMKKASLKVFVSDENPIPLKKKKKFTEFFFSTQNENSFIEFHGNDI